MTQNQRPPRWIAKFEPLVWERAEAESERSSAETQSGTMPTRFAQSLTVRRMARMDHAIKTAGFDPDWDTKKCELCGKAFKLKPGRGQWMKRRYCSEACKNAAKQVRHRARPGNSDS